MKVLNVLRRRPIACALAALLAAAAEPGATAAPASVRAPAQPGPASRGTIDAPAAIHAVSNCNDSGTGSLRDAIAGAADNDTIDLVGLACSTITLTSGEITIGVGGLTLRGPADTRVTIDGGGTDRIFNHTSGLLSIEHVTLRNGFALNEGGCLYSSGDVYARDAHFDACTVESDKPSASGGAIYTLGSLTMRDSSVTSSSATTHAGYARGGGITTRGFLTLDGVTVHGNRAMSSQPSGGGGIYALDSEIDNSTIDGNYAFFGGAAVLFPNLAVSRDAITSTTIANNAAYAIGGIDVLGSGIFYLESSTIAFNCAQSQSYDGRAAVYGIGLRGDIAANPLQLHNTIIASNGYCDSRRTAPSTAVYDVSLFSGSIDGTHNLVTSSSAPLPADTLIADPLLMPLADNGGATMTLAPAAASPAIDTGEIGAGSAGLYDERRGGFARTVGAAADIGAYERQSTGVVHTVSTCADAGAGSLRDAIAGSSSGDTIDLTNIGCGTITLASALTTSLGNITLHGPGASALTIDAASHDRVFNHAGYGTLHIDGMTLANGLVDGGDGIARGGCVHSATTISLSRATVTGCRANGGSAYGGGIDAQRAILSASTLSGNGANGTTLSRGGGVYAATDLIVDTSLVTGNTTPAGALNMSGRGGGLYAAKNARVYASTITANQANYGAGIVAASGTGDGLTLVDSTVSSNVGFLIGGVFGNVAAIVSSTIAFNTGSPPQNLVIANGVVTSAHTRIESSIFFGNTCNGSPYDLGSGIFAGRFSGNNNLVGTAPIVLPPDTIVADPLLGPLQDNGGPTPTHALGMDSPAVDHGNNVAVLVNDQRGAGFARESGAAADIGAFEIQTSDTSDAIFANGFD